MTKNPLDIIKESDQKLFESILSTKDLAFQEGALSRKNKLLIALAIDAAHGAENGVRSLATQAIDAGATKDEIMEALRVVNYICSAGSMYTAARALNDVFK